MCRLNLRSVSEETTVVTVKIGGEERRIDEVDPHWINQQINARRNAGESVCVRVTIADGEVDLLLSTPNCETGAGGSRQARPRELEVLDLWKQRGLTEEDFTGGGLVAFLQQVERFL